MSGIILDTCVVSELKRRDPDPRVIHWFADQAVNALHLTATVVSELAEGIERLPFGRRRMSMEAWLDRLVGDSFANRILAFDVDAALVCGRLTALAYSLGRPPGVGDAQIAAVARKHGMAVATRNLRDYEAFGIPLLDPWRGV